jgi:hypothetical protein
MCVWLSGTPRPANHDGCEPVQSHGRSSRTLHPVLFAPVAIALVLVAMSSAGTVTFPSVGVMIATVAVVGVIVVGVGVGVLSQLPRTSDTRPVTVLSGENVRYLARCTLTEYAAVNGYQIDTAHAEALLPSRSSFAPMAPATASSFCVSLVADIVNTAAIEQGSPSRITPAQVRRLIEVS